jgi:alpha-glucosidase
VKLASLQALLIDMDGTLVDSDAAVERAWTVWATEHGVDPRAALAPGATELLAAADRLGLPWAVVTSADHRLASARLHTAGLGPEVVITAEDVSAGKPDPEGYLLAAAKLGVNPGECLVVEDSAAGARAGKEAGALVAALKGVPADIQLADLGELARLLMSSRAGTSWPGSVGYEIYLPSFQDGNGDGWGDLAGVTSRLDYLHDLGVDVLWLTPFFPTPMRDHGYDIADYRGVDERFGTMADLDRLLAEAHRRGLSVVADLVVNHTSDRHPWFERSRSSREDPYRDYYIWRDPRPDGGPPNNWMSHFGGPAWTYDEQTGQYYLHLFTSCQPDLHWENPVVADEVDAIIRFWLDRGLDGFRIDTAHCLAKQSGLPDNPLLAEAEVPRGHGAVAEWLRQDHRHDLALPAAIDIHQRWRAIADQYQALLVGEVYITDPVRLAAYVDGRGLHSAFFFGLVEAGWDAEAIGPMIAAAAAASPSLSWVQSSHDRQRAVTRYGGGQRGWRRWLALSVLLAALPGPLFLYQGEELGLADGIVGVEHDDDPLALGGGVSRVGCRTPMPWEPGPALGFTSAAQAWMPFGGRSATETVTAQQGDPASPLSVTRRLLAARRELAVAGHGPVDWLELGPLVGFRRGDVLAAANLSEQPVTLDASGESWQACFDTNAAGRALGEIRGPVQLSPLQAILAVR